METEAAPLGFFARLGGVFFAPAGVFQDLRQRPSWLAPLLVITLAVVGLNAMVAFSATGLEAMRQEFLAQVPENTPPETVEQQLGMYRMFAPIGALISVPLFLVVLAGLLYVVFSVVLGGEGTFRQTFSAYSHAGYIGLVGGVVGRR
jgi:hypothetical protein